MALRNAFGALGLDATLQAIRDKLPAALVGGRVAVDGSGVTQPVSDGGGSLTVDGAVTANAGTNLNTSALALETGGNLATILGRLPANLTVTSTRLLVDANGTVTANAGTNLNTSALALESGGNLAAVNAKTPALVATVPPNNASAPPTRIVGQDIWNCSFADVGASVLSSDFISPVVGTGVGYSQAGGSLLITTGTSTNAEFFTRSTQSWRGSMRMRFSLVASQRIANQNLQVTLADLIGSALAYTIVSATVVNVTMTAHGYTALNVGQFMNLGAITGAAGVPGRYAIASIPDADTIRFTVAGWPGSGSGTLTLFGWNYVRNLVTGVTAANLAWDAQRRGWASGDTTATINTTASPGTIVQNDLNGRDAFLMDQLRATSVAPTFASRASRYENLPDDDTVLFVFIWSYNGTTAPASTTTWTLGFVSVEKFANTPVYIQGARANGSANAVPVQVIGGGLATQPISGTVTANQGTMVALPAGTNAIGDVGQQYRASNTGAGTVTALTCPATPAVQTIKGTAGRLLGLYLVNTNATIRYIKIYNATAPTLASTAATMRIPLPQNQPVFINFEGGMGFATAITCAITSTASITDSTGAVTLDDVTGFSVHA